MRRWRQVLLFLSTECMLIFQGEFSLKIMSMKWVSRSSMISPTGVDPRPYSAEELKSLVEAYLHNTLKASKFLVVSQIYPPNFLRTAKCIMVFPFPLEESKQVLVSMRKFQVQVPFCKSISNTSTLLFSTQR
jgi:hypothetical protein